MTYITIQPQINRQQHLQKIHSSRKESPFSYLEYFNKTPFPAIVFDEELNVKEANHHAENLIGYIASPKPVTARDIFHQLDEERLNEIKMLSNNHKKTGYLFIKTPVENHDANILIFTYRQHTKHRYVAFISTTSPPPAVHKQLVITEEEFQERLQNATTNGIKDQHKVGLLSMELKYFDEITKTLNKEEKYFLKYQIETRILRQLRKKDTLKKITRGKIKIILENTCTQIAINSATQRIKSSFDYPFLCDGKIIYIKLIIDIRIIGDNENSINKTSENSDNVLKKENSNYLINILNAAWRKQSQQDTAINYQAIFDATDETIIGFEVSLQKKSYEKSQMDKNYCSAYLKNDEQMSDSDEAMLKTISKDLDRLESTINYRLFKLAIKLMPNQLHSEKFIVQLIKLFKYRSESIEVVIPETLFQMPFPSTKKNIQALSENGLNLALSLVDISHASLFNLNLQPINIVKIDEEIIGRIRHSEKHNLIPAIATQCNSLDIKITVSGIESKEQFDFYQNLPCQRMQGEMLAPTMKIDNLIKWLKKSGRCLSTQCQSL